MNQAVQVPAVIPGWGDPTQKRENSRKVLADPELFLSVNQKEKSIVDKMNMLVQKSIELGASDIHFEGTTLAMDVRFRLNGIMTKIDTFNKYDSQIVEQKVRERCKLPVYERASDQDGRMSFVLPGGHEIDMRVSILPTRTGCSIVCRIIDQTSGSRRLADVEMNSGVRGEFHKILERPDGLFLMTGPTGSGKTSTLYAALNELNTEDRKILTIEDPVEIRLAGTNQVEISNDISFSGALRAALRQDPDVILVGEIRDTETAKTALQAAMTGHLVLSTLHANDAASTLTRLTDLGVDPFTLGACIQGVIAQRLAPCVCNDCRVRIEPNEGELAWLQERGYGIEHEFFEGEGCESCDKRGTRGRIPIMEMITASPAILAAIETRTTKAVQAAAELQQQYESLERCAMRHAISGRISLKTARSIGSKS